MRVSRSERWAEGLVEALCADVRALTADARVRAAELSMVRRSLRPCFVVVASPEVFSARGFSDPPICSRNFFVATSVLEVLVPLVVCGPAAATEVNGLLCMSLSIRRRCFVRCCRRIWLERVASIWDVS